MKHGIQHKIVMEDSVIATHACCLLPDKMVHIKEEFLCRECDLQEYECMSQPPANIGEGGRVLEALWRLLPTECCHKEGQVQFTSL